MAQDASEKNYMYFQYLKGADLPVYLKVELGAGLDELVSMIPSYGFHSLSDAEVKEAEAQVAKLFEARILTISPASSGVERQIQQVIHSDQYGVESLTPRKGYKVYRYKSVALMVYSIAAREWTLGASLDGVGPKQKDAWRQILNRYLSLALAPLGYVGFFGVPTKDGMIVLKARESGGESVFVDVVKGRVLSVEGAKALSPKFQFIRLGATLKGRSVKMTREDLFSFLCMSTSYLDYEGLPVPVRQMIQVLARTLSGAIEPREAHFELEA